MTMTTDTDALLLRLALATTECPHEAVLAWDDGGECVACDPDGQVPLVEGIREKCLGWTRWIEEPIEFTENWEPDYPWQIFSQYPCDFGSNCGCQGRGWTVTTDAETIAGALWPLLDSLLYMELPAPVHLLVQAYAGFMVSGHFAEAWQAAARALEEAGLMEREETP